MKRYKSIFTESTDNPFHSDVKSQMGQHRSQWVTDPWAEKPDLRPDEEKVDYPSVVQTLASAKKIVKISHLVWGKDSVPVKEHFQIDNITPDGWRLPTIRELYTAHVKKVKGFLPVPYWCENGDDWCFDFEDGEVKNNYGRNKRTQFYVRFVREM